MMLSGCCTQYVSKSERPSSGQRTTKSQSSSQFPRRVVLKNVLTIGQLYSSPMLVRSCLKSVSIAMSSNLKICINYDTNFVNGYPLLTKWKKSKFQNLCFPSDMRLWIKFLVEDKTFNIHQSKVLKRKLVNVHLEVKI